MSYPMTAASPLPFPHPEDLHRLELISAVWQVVSRADLSIADKITEVLRVGCEMFGEQVGIVSHIEDGRYAVVHSYAPGFDIQAGAVFDLTKTYCSITLEAGDVVAIDHMGDSEWSTHPAYRDLGLESYIGVEVRVGGRPYGTLNFSSPEVRPDGFRFVDREFVAMLAEWVGDVLTTEMSHQRDLERASDRASYFAHLSHELRAPAAGIIGVANVLTAGVHGPLSTEQEDLLGKVKGAAEHLLRLIADALDLARADAGALELEPTELEVASVVEKAAAMVEGQVHERDLSCTRHVPADLPQAYGDDLRATQILVNLLSNAAKFTPSGGSIGIEAAAAGGFVEIAVWDDGEGIDSELLDQLFKPYAQGRKPRSENGQSTGLGLALSKRLAESLGGHITVASRVGAGSRFTLSLPAA